MIALVLGALVELPVLVDVAAGDDCAEAKDGFGAGQAPDGAGDAHPILDEIAAGALDDASRDRVAGREVLVVAEVRGVVEQVVGALVDRLALLIIEAAVGRAALSDISADDGASGIMPLDGMLDLRYNAILQQMKANGESPSEHATYAGRPEALFVHKIIASRTRSYYFREQRIKPNEVPYAMSRRLSE